MSREIRVGDEVLVKFKVAYISSRGKLYSYDLIPSGGKTTRNVVDSKDVVEILNRPIQVGDMFKKGDFVYKIETVIQSSKDESFWYVLSCNGHIQMSLREEQTLKNNYTRVEE